MNKNHNKYQFNCHDSFIKEFNKIINKHKCPSLTKDFERLKTVLIQELEDNNLNFPNHVCNRISGLNKKVYLPAFIIKNFRCAKINKGSNSRFRLTFVYDKSEYLIYFVEIFNKNQKPIEDKERINRLF